MLPKLTVAVQPVARFEAGHGSLVCLAADGSLAAAAAPAQRGRCGIAAGGGVDDPGCVSAALGRHGSAPSAAALIRTTLQASSPVGPWRTSNSTRAPRLSAARSPPAMLVDRKSRSSSPSSAQTEPVPLPFVSNRLTVPVARTVSASRRLRRESLLHASCRPWLLPSRASARVGLNRVPGNAGRSSGRSPIAAAEKSRHHSVLGAGVASAAARTVPRSAAGAPAPARSGSPGATPRATPRRPRPRSRSRCGSACTRAAGSRAGRGPSRRPSRCRRGARPNITVPISQPADPARLVERDRQRPGPGTPRGEWGRSARASRYTACPPAAARSGTPARGERLAQVRRRADRGTGGSPRRRTSLQALGDRLEVASGQAAVGGKPLGQDEQVAAPLGEVVVVHGEPAADVRHASFLALIVMPSARPAISRTMSAIVRSRRTRLALA